MKKVLETDRRVKKLYSTDKGDQLIAELNKAQDELLQNIYQQVGSDWYDVMEALAKGRLGFDFIKHLKDEKKKASIRNVKNLRILKFKKYVKSV